MFVCDVMFDDEGECERLLESEENRWTEVSWVMFVCDVMFNDDSECERLLGSEEKRGTNVWWVMFVCDVMFDDESSVNVSLEVKKRGEQKSGE